MTEIERTMSKWISVEKELPMYDEEYVKKYDCHKEYIVMIKGAIEPTILYYNGDVFYDDNGVEYSITHWQPLPKPPKENDNV